MKAPRTTLYLGSTSDSEARICFRCLSPSPRTWVYSPTLTAPELREILFPLDTHIQQQTELFSMQSLYVPKGFKQLLEALRCRACDDLLFFGFPFHDVLAHQRSWASFLQKTIRKGVDLRIFIYTRSDLETTELEQSFLPQTQGEQSLRFWIPTQARDLRYVQLPTEDLLQKLSQAPTWAEIGTRTPHPLQVLRGGIPSCAPSKALELRRVYPPQYQS